MFKKSNVSVMDEREKAFRGWAKLVNPDSLRSNLIAASIFLAAYEILRASVIDHIKDFSLMALTKIRK